MTNKELDIRWEQRFSNYRKALEKFNIAIDVIKDSLFDSLRDGQSISDIEMDAKLELQIEGLVQRFEYTHELACKVMADYAKYQGYQDIKGSKDATRYALKYRLVDDELWMEMILNRNRTSHTYDENTAHEIVERIYHKYAKLFSLFEQRMTSLTESELQL